MRQVIDALIALFQPASPSSPRALELTVDLGHRLTMSAIDASWQLSRYPAP